MAVDDTNLITLKSSAEVKLGEASLKKQDLRRFIGNIRSIQMIEDPADKTKKITPKDRVLGDQITTQRRQAIYDSLVTDAVTLGL